MVCRTPVSRLVAVTAALGITAPLRSVTVPEMLPPTAAQVNTASPGSRAGRKNGKTDFMVNVAWGDRAAAIHNATGIQSNAMYRCCNNCGFPSLPRARHAKGECAAMSRNAGNGQAAVQCLRDALR